VFEKRTEHAPVEVAAARRSAEQYASGAATSLRVIDGSHDSAMGERAGAAEACQERPSIGCAHRHGFLLTAA
jgi:hypothetical protein